MDNPVHIGPLQLGPGLHMVGANGVAQDVNVTGRSMVQSAIACGAYGVILFHLKYILQDYIAKCGNNPVKAVLQPALSTIRTIEGLLEAERPAAFISDKAHESWENVKGVLSNLYRNPKTRDGRIATNWTLPVWWEAAHSLTMSLPPILRIAFAALLAMVLPTQMTAMDSLKGDGNITKYQSFLEPDIYQKLAAA